MNEKTGQSLQLVDQLAKTAHEMVDRMHERAVKMEQSFGAQSKEKGEQIVAGFESEVSSLEKYIEENPMMAAMIAFGIGVGASRIFKAMSAGPSEGEEIDEAA